ncbi:MAG: efflux RND transporter permease subunit [Alphaproteobacteria bacterium]|nr:MAG: efflux RND transporter permease subunit [Alphaproteobacteria bacterium]
MIEWFAKNSVAANLLMVIIIVAGVLSLKTQLTLEVFPRADPEYIDVSVALRGATPEDAELGIATRIEEAVQDLPGIERIESTSIEGMTSVRLKVDPDYDTNEVLEQVKGRVDAINTFPAEAEKPVISATIWTMAVIDVVVSGNYHEEEILRFAEQVRDDLLRLDAVSQAELGGVRKYEISIEASQDRLRELGLTLSDIASAIQSSSLDISAGNLRAAGGDVLIRSKGQAYRRTDFENIPVKTNPDGSIIRLMDVATVNDAFEEDSLKVNYNGQQAAFINVHRVGDQSALEVAKAVKDYLKEKQSSLPEGMTLSYWDDDSEVLKNRLGILGSSALQGGTLVLLLLALFLRPKIAMWVFVGIPVSFLGAVVVMSFLGISLNMMSAFGFIVVLGIVVDDAIVTGENVYSHLRTTETGLEAAIKGTKEVAIPVTFGVLTTVVAFAPIALVGGDMGRWFSPIAAVVMPVLLFSLIESKLVLPAHLKHVHLSKEKRKQNKLELWQQRFADGFEAWVLKYYRPVLRLTTEHRYATLSAFVGVFSLILLLIKFGWTQWIFFPPIESDQASASLTMPVGTPFEVTDTYVERMSAAARELQEKYRDEETGLSPVEDILTITGATWRRSSNSTNRGRVRFQVMPAEDRPGQMSEISSGELLQEWRGMIGTVPGAEALNFRASHFRPGNPIEVQLSGNSLDTLNEVGDRIKERLATYPTVFEIADSMSDGKEELKIEVMPQGHVLGLTRSDVARQVGQAFKGIQVQRIQRGRDDIRVIVRFPQSERSTSETLEDMLIRTPTGAQVPLSHVATLIPSKGPSQIRRVDRYRVLTVTADVDKEEANMTLLMGDLRSYIDDLLMQYPGIAYSMEGEAKQEREAMGSMKMAFFGVLFAIYCLLALPLRSYSQPIVIMSVIPFGLIGAVIGHWIVGIYISFLSVLGLMALLGVLVNDSLVLVDYINQRFRAGEKVEHAVLNAGVARFRPVFLTSVTTFFGLMPLMLDQSKSSQFLVPMAVSLGFGVIFATVITLIMVPTNVLIVEDIKRGLNWLWNFFGPARVEDGHHHPGE